MAPSPPPGMLSQASQFRGASPVPSQGKPRLEPIKQPLYSAGCTDDGVALPNELQLFAYKIGSQVAGAGGGAVPQASLWHTNMELAGQLGAPKVFYIEGYRCVVGQIAPPTTAAAATLLDPSTAAAAENSDWQDDLTLLAYTGYAQFNIGEKAYLKTPLINIPGNVGIDGFSGEMGTFAAGTWMRERSLQLAGRYFGTGRQTLMIYPSQSFAFSLFWPQQVKATMIDEHIIWVYLDGILAREVQ